MSEFDYPEICEDCPQRVVVQCKDCKHYDGNECMIKAGWFPVKPDWFCADGERRNEDVR